MVLDGGQDGSIQCMSPDETLMGDTIHTIIKEVLTSQQSLDPDCLCLLEDVLKSWLIVWREKSMRWTNDMIWQRIYQGISRSVHQLGPVTADLLPPMDVDGHGWRLLHAFTGATHITEFISESTDAVQHLVNTSPVTINQKEAKGKQHITSNSCGDNESQSEEVTNGVEEDSAGDQKAGSSDSSREDPRTYRMKRYPGPQHVGKPVALEPAVIHFIQQGKYILERVLVSAVSLEATEDLWFCLYHLVTEQKTGHGRSAITLELYNLLCHLSPEKGTSTQSFDDMRVDTFIKSLTRLVWPVDDPVSARLQATWQELKNEASMEKNTDTLQNIFLRDIAYLLRQQPADYLQTVLLECTVFVEPFSGGFSPRFVELSRCLARHVFWDYRRQCSAFHEDAWHDLGLVFPRLISKLCSVVTLDHVDLNTTGYDCTIRNLQIDFKHVFPRLVTAHKGSRVISDTTNTSWQDTNDVTDRMIYEFKDMSIHCPFLSFVYRKKTGFPLWSDYGSASIDILEMNVQLSVQTLRKTGQKSHMVAEHCQCHIGKVVLRFDETQHRCLNYLHSRSFANAIRQTVSEKIQIIIVNMFNQISTHHCNVHQNGGG